MPVFLLGGTEDAIFPMERIVGRMKKLIPNLKASLIPGMGHALVNMSECIIPFLIA
jgi:pimeloyl-ACP methyl ester carboxylesterase